MLDDIVTRLRGLNAASFHLLCNEAADEIERLRALVERLRALRQAEHFYFCKNKPHGKCITEAEEWLNEAEKRGASGKAVRGE